MNRQWLDLVARSGTPLFVSAQPSAVGPEQASALKSAFAAAAMPQAVAEPIDWMDTTCPSRYRIDNQEVTYDWFGEDGISFSFA
jgi:alpha-galactosidase